MTDRYGRLHTALLSGLSLPHDELVASAGQLHACAAAILSHEACKVVRYATNRGCKTPANGDVGRQGRLAALAVFHKLSSLPKGIPITLVSLHDLIIVFTAPWSPASSDEARLARRVVDVVFRKKPSLIRAIENQLLPAWTEALASFTPSRQDEWILEATALFASISIQCKNTAIHDTIQTSAVSTSFWIALQTFYDITLPQLFSASTGDQSHSIGQLSGIKQCTSLKKEVVDFFSSFFPSMSAETLGQCLENEASNPELPSKLTDLPMTSLVNMTLLQDAEYYHRISRRVGIRKPASVGMSAEERSYLQTALDFGNTIPKDSIGDVLLIISKGKGKSASNGHTDTSSDSDQITQMAAQVLNVLPDASVRDVRRLLTSAALEQVPVDQKVERVISIMLEGESAEPEQSKHPVDQDQSKGLDQPSQQDVTPKTSAFSSIRRNVFDDTIDVSRLHRGKQDFRNDAFLPSELRASILAAAERQAQESEEDRSDDEEDTYAEIDEEAEALSTIKVRDDVSEESGLDEETQGPATDVIQSGGTSGGASRAANSSVSSGLGATGVPKELESLYVTTYTRDASVFMREAKKSPARAELKKKIAELRLPQTIADEQIEGWARMLERNPKKDRILERFNDKQFQGNEKGLDIKNKPTHSQANEGKHEKEGQGGTSTKGATGERGRGRGRGRGGSRQSDQRRRGHDRKMQRAGAL